MLGGSCGGDQIFYARAGIYLLEIKFVNGFVGPAEDFDNLSGAAKKSLYAGAGLYLRFLCGHCIVLCPPSDIFYLALERIEFEYK